MQELSKEEFALSLQQNVESLLHEETLFIYPTDTIYGIGCVATNCAAVRKLRAVKSRSKRPFSVIAPSKQWILDNCEVGTKEQAWIDKLPGAYTLILKLKNKRAVCPECNNDLATLGVRIPKHWISKAVEQMGVPIVTTSANLTGGYYMTSMDDLEPSIKAQVAFCVYEGALKSAPSTLVDLTKEGMDIIKR